MSKEAIGENGAALGSSQCWSHVNRSTFFGGLMGWPSEISDHETLRAVGCRVGVAVEELCDNLQEHRKQLRAIDSGRRNRLAKQVRGPYDVCRMTGSACSHSGECTSMLALSGFFSNPFGEGREIQNAIRKMKDNSDFFPGEGVELLQKAADWSISPK